MKLFLGLLFLSVTAFADLGPVGNSFFQQLDGTAVSGSIEKWFINVKNVSGGALADGTVVVPDTTEDDGYSVTTSTTAGSTPLCIIAKEDGSSCADDAVCRCQTYGLNSGVLFDSTSASATAGQSAYISESNAGYVEAEPTASLAAFDKPIGVFLDTVAASGDVQLFIKLR